MGLAVAKNSPITAKDLIGATIAVSALADFNQLGISGGFDHNGVSPDGRALGRTALFRDGPSPSARHRAGGANRGTGMSAAIRNGDARQFADVYSAIAPEFATIVWFSSKRWLAKQSRCAQETPQRHLRDRTLGNRTIPSPPRSSPKFAASTRRAAFRAGRRENHRLRRRPERRRAPGPDHAPPGPTRDARREQRLRAREPRRIRQLLGNVAGDIAFEEFARSQILAETEHLEEVDKMLRGMPEVVPTSPPSLLEGQRKSRPFASRWS